MNSMRPLMMSVSSSLFLPWIAAAAPIHIPSPHPLPTITPAPSAPVSQVEIDFPADGLSVKTGAGVGSGHEAVFYYGLGGAGSSKAAVTAATSDGVVLGQSSQSQFSLQVFSTPTAAPTTLDKSLDLALSRCEVLAGSLVASAETTKAHLFITISAAPGQALSDAAVNSATTELGASLSQAQAAGFECRVGTK